MNADTRFLVLSTTIIVEKVQYLLIVEFHELGGHFEFGNSDPFISSLFSTSLDFGKEVFHSPRDNPDLMTWLSGKIEARSHGVGLAASSLPVG